MDKNRRAFIKRIGVGSLAAFNVSKAAFATEKHALIDDNMNAGGPVILFQGDSITDGNRTRDKDWNHIMGHGYAYLIASRLWYDYTDKGLMFYNRGVSGNRVKDLDARWQQDALDIKPDVVSILVGVNDVNAVVNQQNPDSVEQFEETYNRIIERTKQALPNCLIVLCEPFILPVGWVNSKTETWQTETKNRQQVVKKLSVAHNTIFIELQEPFNKACEKAEASYWIWDGIHPMPAGHELIARLWINEVKKKLSFLQ